MAESNIRNKAESKYSFENAERYRESLLLVQKRLSKLWMNKVRPETLDDISEIIAFIEHAEDIEALRSNMEGMRNQAAELLKQAQVYDTECGKLATDLRQREAALQEREKMLASSISRMHAVEEREHSVERVESNARGRAEKLGEMETKVKVTFEELTRKAKDTSDLMNKVGTMLEHCREKDLELSARTSSLDQLKISLEVREAAARRHEDELIGFKEQKAELEIEIGRLREKRIPEIESRERQVDEKAKLTDSQNWQVVRHAKALSEREQQQVERDRRLNEREDAIVQRERIQKDLEEALRIKETSLKNAERRLQDLQLQKEELLQSMAAARARI